MANESGKTKEVDTSAQYEQLASQVSASYIPVWNVPKNYLTGFIAQTSAVPEVLADPDPLKARADEDIGLLVQATKELGDNLKKGNKLVLILRVSFSTLEKAQFRNLYLDYCKGLDPDVRSLMVLKVENIDPELSTQRLQDLLREPSTLVRSLIITADIRQRRYEALPNCRIHAFCVSMSAVPMSEAKSFALFDRFVEMLENINHAAMVEDIPNRSLLCAAVGSGFTYVSGPAVQSPQASLDIIRPFDLAEAYKGE